MHMETDDFCAHCYIVCRFTVSVPHSRCLAGAASLAISYRRQEICKAWRGKWRREGVYSQGVASCARVSFVRLRLPLVTRLCKWQVMQRIHEESGSTAKALKTNLDPLV